MSSQVRQEIFDQIEEERAYQDGKWGTEFDDKNTANDWQRYINDYAVKATVQQGFSQEVFETNMRKVAALAIAAIETSQRNSGPARRHYDKLLA